MIIKGDSYMQLADEIRRIARSEFVIPAHRSSRMEFSIAVRELMNKAEASGISTVQRTPAFCTSIQTREFLQENALEILRVDGPASKRSTTVVVHFRFRDQPQRIGDAENPRESIESPTDPLLELSGLLRGAIREGAAAFVRELRRDKDPVQQPGNRRVRSQGREESAA